MLLAAAIKTTALVLVIAFIVTPPALAEWSGQQEIEWDPTDEEDVTPVETREATETDTTINDIPEDEGRLTLAGSVHYSDSNSNCDFTSEPCAPLSDVWGFKSDTGKEYAAVGVANGVDIVDATDPANPKRVKQHVRGCVTEWRDLKCLGDTLYIVNDKTALCTCEEQPCMMSIRAMIGDEIHSYRATEGAVGKPLSEMEDGLTGRAKDGRTVNAENGDGCAEWPAHTFKNRVAVVDRGNCTFGKKVKNAEAAGAIGIIIVNEREDMIYPSMAGNNTGVEIPAVLIGSRDGAALRTLIDKNDRVDIHMNIELKTDSPLYGPPDGLIIVDVTNPLHVNEHVRTREWFDFAHNILVDEDRKLLYACGHSPGSGGILVFDISSPFEPELIGDFNETYIHDIEMSTRPDGTPILVGCAIYNRTVFVFDVTDPHGPLEDKVLVDFETINWPHNSATTDDGEYIYVTHESEDYPVTIWSIADFNNITFIGNFSIGVERGTIPHNAFSDGDYLWLSYYSEGVAVLDIGTNPEEPILIGHYDTSNYTNGYHGVWGVYPVGKDAKRAYASDIEDGLFILEFDRHPHGDDDTAWYFSWWFLTLMGCLLLVVVVAVAAAAVVVYRTRPEREVPVSLTDEL